MKGNNMKDTQEWVRFLFTSPHRKEILSYLLEGSADTREITEATSGSRPSVQRHLNEFLDRNWAEKHNGEYNLTASGEYITRHLREFISKIDNINKGQPFIENLPELEPPFEIDFLTAACLVMAEPDRPHAPTEFYIDQLQRSASKEITVICPIQSPFFQKLYKKLLDQGTNIHLVLPKNLLKGEKPTRKDIVEINERYQSLNVYSSINDVNFILAISGDDTYVGVFKEGHFVACLESTSSNMNKWAQEVYENYYSESQPISELDHI